MFLTSLKQICNEYLIKFSENQSAPKLENRKTSPCSPCAPNLLHVLMSRTTGYHNLCSPDYSSPRPVVDWMEELIVGLLLVENEWCQKQSWSFMHLLCSGMVGFGLRRKLGTAGTERDSPLVLPPWPGGILILLAGFVLFSTVVFLSDLEIYFFVHVSRQ